MKAIILAAGLGSRLLPLTEDKPKCLVEFSGKTLLERLLKTFKSCGVNDVVLVSGHKSEKINYADLDLVKNEKYSKTGIIHSLFCAREKFEKTVIVAYGDIIFENSVLEKLLKSKYDITAVVDKKWKRYWELRMTEPLSDAESLLMDEKNFITNIGEKNLKDFDKICGQFIGLIMFQNKGLNDLKDFFRKIFYETSKESNPLNPNVPFEQSTLTNFLQGMIMNGHKIKAIPIENGWLEFDTVKDLEIYNKMLTNNTLSDFINIQD
tara:strand:+ start:49 stop:843 length:795 start_codon:yes stop_codon:yes gene_type:complete